MFFIPIYILILFFTIIIDYFAGLFIENATGRKRKVILIISIISNVGVLAFFKYFNFLNDNIRALSELLHWNYSIDSLAIILPIGLSFHTFQAMSYTIEVYRGNQKAERHFGIYALYVMFYPQLVAGPIERPQNLLHQFHEEKYLNYANVSNGLKLILWGLFKKVVVADRLAVYVNAVYENPYHHSGATLALATVFFAVQIYCDFSGYSEIAIGSARVMGFKLMQNFDKPYFSKSISEFWSRWHISLSTWFRDYLYIPLGGNRVALWRWYYNLFFVFLISGLWHGANWTYVVWGGLHGCYLISGNLFAKVKEAAISAFQFNRFSFIHKLLQTAFIFFIVCIGWIYFRAANITQANYVVTQIFNSNWSPLYIGEKTQMAYGIFGILFLFIIEAFQKNRNAHEFFNAFGLKTRWSMYLALTLIILLIGVSEGEQFIYFQF
jgi:D-alanyl-lipoteichoic acid acyltransferase DltB (MBOAT superfamily)